MKRSTLVNVGETILLCGVLFYVILFPLGISLREIGSLVALAGLGLVLVFGYRETNVRRFPLKLAYFLLLLLFVFKSFHSENPSAGFYVLLGNSYKGLVLIFVGMEFVRSEFRLKSLVYAFALMGMYEGLDGIYQYFTGYDFIMGTRHFSHRLTGSLSSPRVGNLMSLVLPVTFALPMVLPVAWSRIKKALICGVVWFPAIFLMIGAKTRSAYLGFAVALVVYAVIRGKIGWKIVTGLASLLLGVVILGPERVSWQRLMHDHRLLDVWPISWEVFKEYPILGAGLNSFDFTYKMLGLMPQHMKSELGHPHNIYLQLLCETGFVGLGLFLAFVGGSVIWGFRHIRRGLQDDPQSIYWVVASAFWSSYVGYLATAFTAHNFFRSWWLGMAMLILGVAMGACARIPLTAQNSLSTKVFFQKRM